MDIYVSQGSYVACEVSFGILDQEDNHQIFSFYEVLQMGQRQEDRQR